MDQTLYCTSIQFWFKAKSHSSCFKIYWYSFQPAKIIWCLLKETGKVLIDLENAFDTVDHQIIRSKLQVMGVSNINLLQSYITRRKQLVYVNGTESNLAEISCGDHILFLCYVNDMSISRNSSCKLLLYASCFLIKIQNLSLKKPGKELESCC